ncbi:MAG: glycosyltransferase family 2 protein [Candidatus Sumerlaeia bacterium]|nr:glycosyltransferase family 2 protein [Candidatus Sumerlaeia bacterium]
MSFVVPCYNEEESLPALHERISKVAQNSTDTYEIIFANDGSTDATLKLIRSLCRKDPHVKGLDLSRNFGHQVCLTAALDHARGDVILMLDADLQDPPELLPEMLDKWREGADVVYAVRSQRKGESIFKLLTAKIFYRILKWSTKINIPVDTGDFRLIDAKALQAMLSLRERNRFLRGMFSWVGFHQEPVYYDRDERFAGTTKYPLRKMIHLAIDGITSFSIMPLRAAALLGLVSATIAFIYSIMVLHTGIYGGGVPGWASTTLSVLFLGGVQLVTIGILGEYIGRVFDEVKNRPLYFVREVIDQDHETNPGGESTDTASRDA